MKKFTSILLALVLVLAMSTVALASGDVATTGTITIENAAKGQTYKIYKLFNATVTGSADGGSIAYTGEIPTSLAAYFEKDTAGNITAKVDPITNEMSAAMLKWANSQDNATAEKNGEGTALVFDDLAFGYYVIVSSQGTAISVDSTNPSVTVKDKNTTKPTTPTDPEDLKKVDDAEVAVGDTASYTIQFNAVNYETSGSGTSVTTKKIEKYTVTDIPTNIAINENTVAIKVGGTTIDKFTATKNTDTGVVTIEIPWVDVSTGAHLYNSPAKVEITYTATVLDAAATGTAKNSVSVTDNQGTTLTDEDELVIAKFELIKYTMVESAETTLTGAKFKLYDAATGDKQIYVVKNNDGSYSVTATPNDVVIEAGQVTIHGLDADKTYYIEETEAPAGYNKLTARQEVQPSANSMTQAKVLNQSGSALPSTGGMGTTIFYVVGGLLMAAAVVLLVSKKIVAANK